MRTLSRGEAPPIQCILAAGEVMGGHGGIGVGAVTTGVALVN